MNTHHNIPLAVPNLTGNEREYLNRCIDTTFVSSVGEFVTRIEADCAGICGAARGVATSSGTTGLHLALLCAGVKPGDIVVIPSFTFIATANAVSHCGAYPWFMDISPDSWTMDADMLESEIAKFTVFEDGKLIHKPTGRRVAVIMPVYTLGNIPDMDAINKTAASRGIPVVADAACAIGAALNGRGIGSLADLTVLSFNGNKTVTAGGGGMVLTNDNALADKAKHISSTARVSAGYDHDMVGYNYRMTNIQAAVGCAQLERLSEFLEKKRYIRRFYDEAFSGVNGVLRFPVPESNQSGCWFSGVLLSGYNHENITGLCAKLKENGIEARSFWKPAHTQKPYRSSLTASSLDVTNQTWDKILTLPCSTGITEDELKYVAETLTALLA